MTWPSSQVQFDSNVADKTEIQSNRRRVRWGATEGAQAMSEHNAERNAERAKTARLKALRWLKRRPKKRLSLRKRKSTRRDPPKRECNGVCEPF
jgi:hypothetical protein